MIKKHIWIGAGLVIVMAGCAAPRTNKIMSQSSLGRELTVAEAQEPTDSVSLRQALSLALLKNPSLEAQQWDVRAAEARMLQAGLVPNPELEFEIEEYDRDGEGADSAETAIVLGQLIELGGKRRWRSRVASAEGELAGWDYESKRLDVFAETTRRFVAVIAAQRSLELARSTVKLTQQTSDAVNERVKAGKEPPLQGSRAAIELEMARLDLFEAASAHQIARKKLAAMWGSGKPVFKQAKGELDYLLNIIPSVEVLQTYLVANPDVARLDAELKLRQAELASEKSARIPDLEAAVGIQSYAEDDTDALAFGVGVSLPLFDRNQGNIAAARHALAKLEAEQRAIRIDLAAELTETHAELTNALRRILALHDKVIPAMEEAFDSARKGYRQGKFSFLDVLDAQRSLLAVRQEHINALSRYHVSLADVQRITGTSMEDITKRKKETK